jgi:prepilin-type N-terminal cleavage/methylation domain-containing protein
MQKKGFTLIELLVVIAIIGILSAIGLVSLNGAREKARDAKRKSDLSSMKAALALYYDDQTPTNHYPAAAAGFLTAISGVIAPTYMAALPTGSTDLYYYMSGTETVADDMYAMFTKLEGTGNWYVVNSVGAGGEIAGSDGHTYAAGTTSCAVAEGATGTMNVCFPVPKITT